MLFSKIKYYNWTCWKCCSAKFRYYIWIVLWNICFL